VLDKAQRTISIGRGEWRARSSETNLQAGAEESLVLGADNDEVDVLVLRGAGYGSDRLAEGDVHIGFVSRMLTSTIWRRSAAVSPSRGDPRSWSRTLALLESMPQPVVAAVDGQAWGGGFELSLACTLRVASERAHFGQPEVSVGLIPGAGGTQRLPRLVGAGRAAELILSGRIIDAHEAAQIGLVEAVLTHDDFINRVMDWIGPIAAKPRTAVRAAKRAIVDGMRLPLDEALILEGRLFMECVTQPAALELQDAVAEVERHSPP
jgi:enoyl-CoA hydratase/carnithine racemase